MEIVEKAIDHSYLALIKMDKEDNRVCPCCSKPIDIACLVIIKVDKGEKIINICGDCYEKLT